jgi:hypothetical protein
MRIELMYGSFAGSSLSTWVPRLTIYYPERQLQVAAQTLLAELFRDRYADPGIRARKSWRGDNSGVTSLEMSCDVSTDLLVR